MSCSNAGNAAYRGITSLQQNDIQWYRHIIKIYQKLHGILGVWFLSNNFHCSICLTIINKIWMPIGPLPWRRLLMPGEEGSIMKSLGGKGSAAGSNIFQFLSDAMWHGTKTTKTALVQGYCRVADDLYIWCTCQGIWMTRLRI